MTFSNLPQVITAGPRSSNSEPGSAVSSNPSPVLPPGAPRLLRRGTQNSLGVREETSQVKQSSPTRATQGSRCACQTVSQRRRYLPWSFYCEDPNIRYYRRLSDLQQTRQLEYKLAEVIEGAKETETWIATFTSKLPAAYSRNMRLTIPASAIVLRSFLSNGSHPDGVGMTFVGTGKTRGAAREAAAWQAMAAMNLV